MTRFLFATALACVLACGAASELEPGAAYASSNSCVQAHERILSDVAALATAHATGCTTDADCTLADTSISCQENCQAGVRADRKDALRSALDDYAVRTCPSAPTDCYVSSACAAHTGAACVEGTCQPVPAG